MDVLPGLTRVCELDGKFCIPTCPCVYTLSSCIVFHEANRCSLLVGVGGVALVLKVMPTK